MHIMCFGFGIKYSTNNNNNKNYKECAILKYDKISLET